jgi:Subtilase family
LKKLILAAAAVGALLALAAAQAAGKKVVESQTDMPRYSYPLTSPASELVQADEPTFDAFAGAVRRNLDKTFDQYEIHDRATLRELARLRLSLQLLAQQNDAALKTVRQLRELQDKPDAKLVTGLIEEAVIKARLATRATDGEAYEAAVTSNLNSMLAPLPWSVVGDALKEQEGGLEIRTGRLAVGFVEHEVDPSVARNGSVNDEGAGQIIAARRFIKVIDPIRPILISSMKRYITARNALKPDIWAARDVSLPCAGCTLTPVVIGIWDSGVDTAVYATQLYSDPMPEAHSAHGLAFERDGSLGRADLQTLPQDERSDYRRLLTLYQGLNDVENQIDSPQATELKSLTADTPAPQMSTLVQHLLDFGQYVHGTHVAGIATRGNPAARLVVFRFNDDLPEYRFAPTTAWAQRLAEDFGQVGRYCREHDVRVVNMSWADNVDEFEEWLSKSDAEKDVGKRKAQATALFAIWRKAIEEAIKSAPGTLFVAAAGNADNSASFNGMAPASLKLPNLITVGAVNQAGDETTFTSYGDTVVVDAAGFQVDSQIPGGAHLRLSGTSMAAPNVANLAGKLFAIAPTLTPEEAIALIRKGADVSADGRRHLINPKQTLTLLKQEHKS